MKRPLIITRRIRPIGFLVIDLLTEEVKHLDRAPGYEYGMSASHARRELVRMAKAGDKRTERVVMWY